MISSEQFGVLGRGDQLLFIFYIKTTTLQEKHGPVGLVQIDAHPDKSDTVFGEKLTNSTPFRRAVEEGLLDCERVVQIGLRGAGNTPRDYEYGRQQVSACFLKVLLR